MKEDENKFGIGVSGILSAGIDFNTTKIFFGAGPGLSAHYWWLTKSVTAGGQTTTATADMTTLDFDLNFVMGIDDMFATVGRGKSTINIGAAVDGESTTVKLTDSATYLKVMFGFRDAITWGITFMQYFAPYKGMNRIELNIGF